ncbi:hypothetical protein C4F51_11420 [Cellvibrio sp. KB43]|uniref:DUF5648 domain-containing protein n=2 Tax=Cellvibrio polysaccharolyticus TaxID=2082724 RepID=A0A928YW40_9GAMM|nr:hypothetical protein [Cellvibrio polysaccharolyticus]
MLNKYLLMGTLLASSSLMAYDQQENAVIQPITQPISAFEPFTVFVKNTTNHPSIYIFSKKIVGNEIEIVYTHERNSVGSFGYYPEPETPPVIPLVTFNGLPGGVYTLKTIGLPYSFNALSLEDEVELVVEDSPATIDVYELFNTTYRSYFITQDSSERDHLISQPDISWGINHWYEISAGFKAWAVEGAAPSTALPVCRLYSAHVESHYYTIDEEECDFLQTLGWQFQGDAFKAIPAVGGVCPSGTVAVLRLYIDRMPSSTMNHRFTTDAEAYQSMIHQGWTGEGVAFCSPE